MASFVLRRINPELWARVQARAATEGITIKALILKALAQYVALPVVIALSAACAYDSPAAPAPVITAPSTAPASIRLVAATRPDRATDITATVLTASGNFVEGSLVIFTTSRGTLTPEAVITDGHGVARSILVATQTTTVRAQADGLEASVSVLPASIARVDSDRGNGIANTVIASPLGTRSYGIAGAYAISGGALLTDERLTPDDLRVGLRNTILFSTTSARRCSPSYANSDRCVPAFTATSRFFASHSNVRVPSVVRLPFASMGAPTGGSVADKGPHDVQVVVMTVRGASTIDSTVAQVMTREARDHGEQKDVDFHRDAQVEATSSSAS